LIDNSKNPPHLLERLLVLGDEPIKGLFGWKVIYLNDILLLENPTSGVFGQYLFHYKKIKGF